MSKPGASTQPASSRTRTIPTKAKQLLQEAGYPGKFNPQTITLYTTAVAADLMQILQGYWQAVGVNVDVQVVDTPVYNGLVFVRAKDPTDKQVGAIWPWVERRRLQQRLSLGQHVHVDRRAHHRATTQGRRDVSGRHQPSWTRPKPRSCGRT